MHPLLEEREEKNVLVVFVAGDKGFAGAFNSNIVKAGQAFIGESDCAGKDGRHGADRPQGRHARG